jgi:hypothetical protein
MITPLTAAAFYDCFESVFAAIGNDVPALRRFPGQVPKWGYPLDDGSLSFAFVTSARAASLLPHMPGEFRVVITWIQYARRVARGGEVSLFQYTSALDTVEYAQHQRRALDKFVQHPGNAERRVLFPYATDPDWLPSATDDEWCYYFDASDVFAWADWYRRVLPRWLDEFQRSPESRSDWTMRVMQLRRAELADGQRARRNSATSIAASSAIAPPRSSEPFTTGRLE